jgi:hypothetical protein
MRWKELLTCVLVCLLKEAVELSKDASVDYHCFGLSARKPYMVACFMQQHFRVTAVVPAYARRCLHHQAQVLPRLSCEVPGGHVRLW